MTDEFLGCRNLAPQGCRSNDHTCRPRLAVLACRSSTPGNAIPLLTHTHHTLSLSLPLTLSPTVPLSLTCFAAAVVVVVVLAGAGNQDQPSDRSDSEAG